ncbi:MAG: FtsX-like permease family protein [Acidobacteriia bacterium]|nr:FtsX-like permease family protein [Terriglobia bacterium]
MKYLQFLLRNLLRNRRRTILTVTSIAVSLFLVTTLRTVLTELESPPSTPESALRLITRHRVSLANMLPIAYRAKIAQVEGVEAVVGEMWFGGVYKDPKNFFPQFSVDTDQFFAVNADMVLPESEKEAFLADRTGALVGDNLAERFGWKAGDRIHLTGALFEFDPELTVRAIYRAGSDDGSSLFFHWEYFNEGLKASGFAGSDFTGTFSIRVRSADEVAAVAGRVDELFHNSTAPTKTESEKAFVLGFLTMMGNVRFLITAISSVVIFTIVLVASNTMAMSIRERIREIGILKALGFKKAHVLSLLIGESTLLAMMGALIGSLGAKALFSRFKISSFTAGFVQRFNVTMGTVALCAAIGLFVGVVAAGVPAWQAARRQVVDALRRVD